jgi:hypothetical protein
VTHRSCCRVLFAVVVILPMPVWAQTDVFATIAEGYTSAGAWLPMKVGLRMFSAPDMDALCGAPGRPRQLVPRNETMSIPAGEWFDLGRLRVAGVDDKGQPLAPVPIAIQVDTSAGSQLFNLRSDAISNGRIMPVRAGRTRFARRIALRRFVDSYPRRGPQRARIVRRLDARSGNERRRAACAVPDRTGRSEALGNPS